MEEKRICQSCKGEFVVAAEDFAFYEKIKVPAPTWCPECRLQRRQARYLNIFGPTMYQRKCDATGKNLITMFRPNTDFPVYDRSYWFSDAWDPRDYGRDYDFSKSFFEQFHELQKQVPRFHVYSVNSENCDYCKAATESKDSYLSSGLYMQNCMYSNLFNGKDCVDCYICSDSELCYEGVGLVKCYNVAFSHYSENCNDSAFLYDCKNCSNCFGCVNLRNKSYYIFNKPYSKEAYEKEIQKYNIRSFASVEKTRKAFSEFLVSQPKIFARVANSENCTGHQIRNSKNLTQCFDVFEGEDGKYITISGKSLRDSYDIFDAGFEAQLLYESAGAGGKASNLYFCTWTTWGVNNISYSDLCKGSSDLFGCVGLTNKSYCILNKQYTKSEYEALLPKIIQHMTDLPYEDALGRTYGYGEFFPPELSIHPYEDTVAPLYFPLSPTEISAKGFRSGQEGELLQKPGLSYQDLPDNIDDFSDSCTSIQGSCGHGSRMIPQEVAFYKKVGVSLPRKCPDCRSRVRYASNMFKSLYARKCQCLGVTSEKGAYQNKQGHFHDTSACPNEFESVFSNEAKDVVYCEQCFQSELIS